MKKIVILVVVILLTFVFLSELKASTLQKSIIPAEAEWVIHFDVEKFRSTQIGKQLLDQEDILGLGKSNARFHDHYQIDILNDINGVTVYGYGNDEENTVLCLRGNFDRDYLLGLLGAEESHKEIPYGTFIIHAWDNHEFGIFVDENFGLLASSEAAIRKALDVISGKKADITTSPLKSYIDGISSDVFFAALAKDISQMAEHEKDVFVFRKTESAVFTLTEVREDVHMKLNFTVKTLEDAKNMESVIRGLISLANMQLEETQKDILLPQEEIEISTQGKEVRVELAYPVKELVDIVLGRKNFFPFHRLPGLHPD